MSSEYLARLFQQRSQARIIMDNSERLSGRLPEYRLIGESELVLTIWAANVS